MTIYLSTVIDTPGAFGEAERVRSAEDCALVVDDGVIVARLDAAEAADRFPEHEVVDLRDGILFPGLVDTHVHFPQVRAIGGLGMPLLEWLERCALPEEVRLSDVDYARAVAGDFVRGLVDAGTTTALVFGSHFPDAVDALFATASEVGVRVTSGLVVSDRILPEQLLVTPERAASASAALADRWHGEGRLRYAVTPRFSLSASDDMLAACGGVADDLWFTSHVNENPTEIVEVGRLFPEADGYVDTYDRHGLLDERSVLAHNVHPTAAELGVLSERGTAVAHCPTSNFSLGSGLFPLREHLEAGVRVALGSDVGAGTGFSILQEGLQAYFGQRLLGPEGRPLAPADLLHLATRSGAEALGLAETVGDLSVGREFDAIWVRPPGGGTLRRLVDSAVDADDAVAKIFAVAGPSDIAAVWVGGDRVSGATSESTRGSMTEATPKRRTN
ncbi:MAG: guanine deaminase [Nesterenkonia sp.]|nr:guanine deaminase [Nesterenkonia sp.]